MSSHSVRLSKALRDLVTLQKALDVNPESDYQRGFYNGIELTLSLLQNKEPQYKKESCSASSEEAGIE